MSPSTKSQKQGSHTSRDLGTLTRPRRASFLRMYIRRIPHTLFAGPPPPSRLAVRFHRILTDSNLGLRWTTI